MGKIKATPQVGQDGQPSKTVLLEITYGGTESPFGGIDSSASPAYIDPKCFASSDGFIVVDNKLCVASWQEALIPVLWLGTPGISLIKIGSFYNSLYGQLNYALGYIATPFGATGVTATGVAYSFYLTSWLASAPNAPNNDILTLTLFDGASIIEQASLTLDCIASGASNSTSAATGGILNIVGVSGSGQIVSYTFTGGTGYAIGDYVQVIQVTTVVGGPAIVANSAVIEITGVGGGGAITTSTLTNSGMGYKVAQAYPNNILSADLELVINGPAGGPTTYTISALSTSYNRQSLVAAMVTAINAGPDPNVTASSSIDGYSIILTALAGGVAGNSVTVQDTSTGSSAPFAPPFYFSCRVARNLEGGQISESSAAPRSFIMPVSAAEVGGTVYFANLGPMILKFSGPGLFTTSSLYNGFGFLRKFAGSLIGLRQQNQLGVFTQNQDMIFGWSAAEDLDEWSPLTVAGLVTGAGFAQLADIGDYLTGLVVSNNTAFIIRSQGLSYATALGSGTDPFSFAHIGLGDQGEGCQNSSLVCQYDQTGAYVGNSDIFQISGSISSIGAKIKALLFSVLSNTLAKYTGSSTCAIYLCGDTFPVVLFVFENSIFLYNTSNQTWSLFTYTGVLNAGTFCVDFLMFPSTTSTNAIFTPVIAFDTSTGLEFIAMYEGVGGLITVSNEAQVTFPQEELVLGRDVTIDSFYVSLFAEINSPLVINFNIIGVVKNSDGVWIPTTQPFASVTLEPADFPSIGDIPSELQIFPSIFPGNSPTGVFTSHSPQLQIVIPNTTDEYSHLVRFTKIMMLASFDPDQRPQ